MLALTAAVASCDDDKDIDPRYTDYRYDVVTYRGTEGGTARFDLVARDDDGMTVLTAAAAIDTAIHQGQRVLIRYNFADSSRAGGARRINLYQTVRITYDSLRYTVNPLSYYLDQMEPVRLRSIWRTGDYLNLNCQVEYTGKPRHFYLLLDSATHRRDTVDCYLVNNTFGDTTYHLRTGYASFFVGSVTRVPTCQVLRVRLNNRSVGTVTDHLFKINH